MPILPLANRPTSSLPPPWAGLDASPSVTRSWRNCSDSRTRGSSVLGSSQRYPPPRCAELGSLAENVSHSQRPPGALVWVTKLVSLTYSHGTTPPHSRLFQKNARNCPLAESLSCRAAEWKSSLVQLSDRRSRPARWNAAVL